MCAFWSQNYGYLLRKKSKIAIVRQFTIQKIYLLLSNSNLFISVYAEETVIRG